MSAQEVLRGVTATVGMLAGTVLIIWATVDGVTNNIPVVHQAPELLGGVAILMVFGAWGTGLITELREQWAEN